MTALLATLGKFLGTGGGGSIGGSMSSTKGSSTSTINSTSTQQGTSTSSGTGDTQTQQTSMDAASKALLDAFTQQMASAQGTGGKGYSKADAVTDVAGTISSIFRQFKEQDLPQIMGQMGLAGAYNSTGAQFLANDAFAEATAKSADTTLQALKDYAGITRENEQAFQSALLNAFNLQAEATKQASTQETGTAQSTSNITETTNSVATEQSKSKSKGLGLSFKL